MRRAETIAHALAERCEEVAAALLGPQTSTTKQELRFGRRGSFALCRNAAKRGLWYDHERGEGGDMLTLVAREHGVALRDAIVIAERDYLGLAVPPARRVVPPAPAAQPQDDNSRYCAAMRMWAETVTLTGTLGERYLIERRGLNVKPLDLEHVLRWHVRHNCMVALMTDAVSGKPTGIHRTYLDSAGAKRERRMLGRKGCIRLSHDDEVTLGLGVTEGIEDGLAVLLTGSRSRCRTLVGWCRKTTSGRAP
jgi:putative DNA primase/helicase